MNYQLLSDEILTGLLKADDEEALREIYLRYWKPLYFTSLKKLHSKEVSEELVQNLFLSLWNKRKTADINNLKPYLNQSIKFLIINFLKSKIIHEKFLHHAAIHLPKEESNCENNLLLHELSFAIDKAIHLLPEKSREVFCLSRFENHSTREISQFMNISEKTVEYHITKSMKLMKVHLKEYIFEMVFVFSMLSFT